jgi:alpha-beta hydrolase superfamily lysophospholipase
MEILNFSVPSSDGVHDLAGKVYLPDGSPKGVVHILHGMTEHIGRYDEFLKEIASNGYLAFAFDNLGHGYTAKDKSELGYIAKKDGYKLLSQDVAVFYNAVREEYGDYPYYLMGHSMGSFIVRYSALEDVSPQKLIVMGTGGKNPLAGIGLFVIKLLKLFKGDRHVSKFMDKMAFGSYNKIFKSEGSRRSWLTSDVSVREKYDKDEFCNYRFTLSAMQDLITLNKEVNSAKWYKIFPKKLPVLLVSGGADPVGNYGKGVNEVNQLLGKNGCNCRAKVYEGMRHEILNEPSVKKDVIQDILDFIKPVKNV